MCIKETQHRFLKVNITDSREHIQSFRVTDDRKGAGLTIIAKKSDSKITDKINANHRDILHAQLNVEHFTFRLILADTATSNNTNDHIMKEVDNYKLK